MCDRSTLPRVTLAARPIVITAVALLAMLSGCSSSAGSGSTKTVTVRVSAVGTPVPPVAVPTDATTVLAKLTAAGLPISNTAVQDENTDPNNLIGRPNEYTSRASFDVPGGDTGGDRYSVDRGGVIEVFRATADASTRVAYIQGLLKKSPILGTEYDYQAGPVLVRIAGKVKPSVAAKFQQALATLDR